MSDEFKVHVYKDAKTAIKAASQGTQKTVLTAIQQLRSAPAERRKEIQHLQDVLYCKYRYRTDGFRLIYEIVEDRGIVAILDAGPRANIYQQR